MIEISGEELAIYGELTPMDDWYQASI
jgi:hypothetical protein